MLEEPSREIIKETVKQACDKEGFELVQIRRILAIQQTHREAFESPRKLPAAEWYVWAQVRTSPGAPITYGRVHLKRPHIEFIVIFDEKFYQ